MLSIWRNGWSIFQNTKSLFLTVINWFLVSRIVNIPRVVGMRSHCELTSWSWPTFQSVRLILPKLLLTTEMPPQLSFPHLEHSCFEKKKIFLCGSCTIFVGWHRSHQVTCCFWYWSLFKKFDVVPRARVKRRKTWWKEHVIGVVDLSRIAIHCELSKYIRNKHFSYIC